MRLRHLLLLFAQERKLYRRVLSAIAAALLLDLFFGTLFYWIEGPYQKNLTLSDSLWWAMVSMTTVGYGDLYPITWIGRFLISFPTMFFGIGLVGYLVGFIAEHIINTLSNVRKGQMKILEKNHIILCNYTEEETLLEMIQELKSDPRHPNRPIVLIDENLQELPLALKEAQVQFVRGNPADEQTLFRANVLECDGVIVLAKVGEPGPDERTYAVGSLIEMIEKENHRPIKTIVEVIHRKNFKLMRRAQVDGMTSAEGFNARLLAQEFINPGLYPIFQQLLSNSEGSQFHLIPTQLSGHRMIDLQVAIIQHPVNIQILGIFRDGEVVLNPPKETVLQPGDHLILLSNSAADFPQFEAAFQNGMSSQN